MTKWQLYRAWTGGDAKKANYSRDEIKEIEAGITACLDGDFEEACNKMVSAGWPYLDGSELGTKGRAKEVYESLRHFARKTGQIAVGGPYPSKAEQLAWEMLENKVHISELITCVATIVDEADEPEIVLKSYEGIEVGGVIKRLRALATIAKDAY